MSEIEREISEKANEKGLTFFAGLVFSSSSSSSTVTARDRLPSRGGRSDGRRRDRSFLLGSSFLPDGLKGRKIKIPQMMTKDFTAREKRTSGASLKCPSHPLMLRETGSSYLG
jgi:hypothetical protein